MKITARGAEFPKLSTFEELPDWPNTAQRTFVRHAHIARPAWYTAQCTAAIQCTPGLSNRLDLMSQTFGSFKN